MDKCKILGIIFVVLLTAGTLNAGSVAGNLSKDWGGGIYECFVYFTEEGEGGKTYRAFTSPSGNFNINPIKQGNYAVVAANPFVYRRAYYPGIYVKGVGTTQVRLTTGCTYHVNAEGWFVEWHKEYAQTFVATGDSIIRIVLNYAGGPSWGTTVKLTIHEGGPDGPQVGPLKTFTAREGGGIPSFSFQAGVIPTTPGQVYAIKLSATEPWSMYHSYGPNDDYPQGFAYVDGEPWPTSDLDITITSDDDGYITMMNTGANSYGAADEYGQTFVAMGYDIACVIFQAAGSSYTARVSIHEGGPDGPQVGPSKLIETAGDVSNAVVWQPGEVPTVPGNTYYVKFVREGGGQAGLYYHVFDPYPDGCMYENGNPTTGDLKLTIRGSKSLSTGRLTGTVRDEAGQGVEKALVRIEGWWKRVLTDENGNYTIDPASASPHDIVVEKDGYVGQYVEDVEIPEGGEATQNMGIVSAPNLIPDGSFESGSFTGWTYYGNISALEPHTGPWLGDIVPYDGTWMIGFANSYTGTNNANGGYYKQISVTPGLYYKFSAWNCLYTSDDFGIDNLKSRIGIDPTGGTDPNSSNIIWSPWNYAEDYWLGVWERMEVGAVAESSTITLFMNYTYHYTSAWRILCFDRLVLSNTALVGTSPRGWLKSSWNLVSVPRTTSNMDPAYAFAPLGYAGNELVNNIYTYSADTGYQVYPADFNLLSLGKGYWLLLSHTATCPIIGSARTGPYTIPLSNGWNLIGNPMDAPIAIADCMISQGSTTLSFEEAGNAGWIQPVLFWYDGTYKTLGVGPENDEQYLMPWKGYWFLALQDSLLLRIPYSPAGLKNGGFESGALSPWNTWGATGGVQTGPWFAGITPRSGTYFFGVATNGGAMNGGVYQTVPVEKGQNYVFLAWILTYREGGESGDVMSRIGIDPTGNTDPTAGTVVWTDYVESQLNWVKLELETLAESNTVTIFLQHKQNSGTTWAINCFDDVALQKIAK